MQLGVEAHIQWIDAFLETEALLDLIEAADIYVTPYRGANQATSGTLSYAMALGKAVVSTPYAHAVELLADDHGVLVPFNDSAALAHEIGALLDNPDRMLRRCRQRAYARAGDDLAGICRALHGVDRGCGIEPRQRPHLHLTAAASASRACCAFAMAPASFSIRSFSVPDRAHGYCVDDNARALMLMNRLGDHAEPHRSRLPPFLPASSKAPGMRRAASSAISWAMPATGWRPPDRRTAADARSGRWARRRMKDGRRRLRQWARGLFDQTAFSARDFGSPRATAFAMLGADYRAGVGCR